MRSWDFFPSLRVCLQQTSCWLEPIHYLDAWLQNVFILLWSKENHSTAAASQLQQATSEIKAKRMAGNLWWQQWSGMYAHTEIWVKVKFAQHLKHVYRRETGTDSMRMVCVQQHSQHIFWVETCVYVCWRGVQYLEDKVRETHTAGRAHLEE